MALWRNTGDRSASIRETNGAPALWPLLLRTVQPVQRLISWRPAAEGNGSLNSAFPIMVETPLPVYTASALGREPGAMTACPDGRFRSRYE